MLPAHTILTASSNVGLIRHNLTESRPLYVYVHVYCKLVYYWYYRDKKNVPGLDHRLTARLKEANTFVYVVCTCMSVFRNWVLTSHSAICTISCSEYKTSYRLATRPCACMFRCGFARLHTGMLRDSVLWQGMGVREESS